MHNSGVGMIISAAGGPRERYKTRKNRFVIAAVMCLPAYSLLFLKHLHHFCPLVRLASNSLQIIRNIKAGSADPLL